MEKSHERRNFIIRIVISALMILVGVLDFVFINDIENLLSNGELYNFRDSAVKMHMIDVDQGDAMLFELPDGKTMLVDCGSEDSSKTLVDFLNSKNIKVIDYLIYTHADEDHVGGGEAIFNTYQVNMLYRPKVLSSTENSQGNSFGYRVKETEIYDRAIMCAYLEDGCQMKYSFEGECILGDKYSIKFLNPDVDGYSNSNNYSAVIMIESFGKKILLQGDAEESVERRLILDYGEYLDVDVLKISHHGSNTGSSVSFLDKTSPEISLISVGENSWRLPSIEVIERLENIDSKILKTADDGNISLGINESGEITILTANSYKKFDMPLVLCVLFIIILLTWGIKIEKRQKK